jgi:Tfp pilus assembly protein PilF
VLRALEIDPQNLKALALAGTAAFDRKDYAAAARYWQRMLPLVEPGSEDARQIQGSIAEARSLGGVAQRALNGRVSIRKNWPRRPRRTTWCSSSRARSKARRCRSR